MKIIKFIFLVTLVIISVGIFAQKRGNLNKHGGNEKKGNWEKLGTVTANSTLDKDVIECSNKGLFNALRFRVEGGRSIDIKAVYIQYGTGAVDKLNFDATIRPGSNSGTLDLKGENRIIKKITIYYKTIAKSNLKSTRLTVWGRHPDK